METQKRFTVMQVNGSPHRMPFKSRLEGKVKLGFLQTQREKER